MEGNKKKSNWEINFKFTKIQLQRESLTVDHCNIIWTICFYFSSRQEVMDSMFLCFNHYYVIKKIITGEACHNKIHSLLKFMIIVLHYQTITYLYGGGFQTVYEGNILKDIWLPFTFFLTFEVLLTAFFVWLIGKMMNKCRLKSELVIFQPHINMRL